MVEQDRASPKRGRLSTVPFMVIVGTVEKLWFKDAFGELTRDIGPDA